jgi:hypothetical protein
MHIGPVLEAAREVQAFLEQNHARFCFIGGLAVQRWGQPRYTKDADLSLLTDFVEDEKWADLLLACFAPRYADARKFALQRRVWLGSNWGRYATKGRARDHHSFQRRGRRRYISCSVGVPADESIGTRRVQRPRPT